MAPYVKKKQFIKLPRFSGGSKALKDFISGNLVYPPEALAHHVEGSIIVQYDISDNGYVMNSKVIKGLGYGCDEEALRLVGMLRYEKVKNRGLRVKVTTRITIHFRPPKGNISYTVTKKPVPKMQDEGQRADKNTPVTYTYTVNIR
jgi:TonB family protein